MALERPAVVFEGRWHEVREAGRPDRRLGLIPVSNLSAIYPQLFDYLTSAWAWATVAGLTVEGLQ